MRAAAALVVVLAGCFSKPGFSGSGSGSDDASGQCTALPPNPTPGLIAVAATREVTWPQGFRLRFGQSAMSLPMPELLTLGGGDILGSSTECSFEDKLGVAVYPVFMGSAGSISSGFSSASFTVRVAGPAFQQYRVMWSRGTFCGQGQLTGESVFSLFPDGRIVRNDSISPPTGTTSASNCVNCAGAVGGTFVATSYLALDLAQFHDLQLTTGTREDPLPGNDSTAAEGGCAVTVNASGRIALRWDRYEGSGPQFATRVRSIQSKLVLVADLARGLVLTQTPLRVRTTMVLDANDATCSTLNERTLRVASAMPISFGGTAVSLDPSEVYAATAEVAGPFVVRTNTDVPGGFVISFPSAGHTAIATDRDPSRVIWQFDQATQRFYVWFHDPLTSATPVTITPGCTN